MQCMKCGRDVEAEQVFCEECLAYMEKYPVKPGTVVQLPPRTAQSPAKKQQTHHRKPAPAPEEQVKSLRKRLRAVTLALVLTAAALAGLAYLSLKDMFSTETKFLPGQNYSSINSTAADETK